MQCPFTRVQNPHDRCSTKISPFKSAASSSRGLRVHIHSNSSSPSSAASSAASSVATAFLVLARLAGFFTAFSSPSPSPSPPSSSSAASSSTDLAARLVPFLGPLAAGAGAFLLIGQLCSLPVDQVTVSSLGNPGRVNRTYGSDT